VPYAAEKLGISYNAAKNNVEVLVGHQILRPGPEYMRPRYFVAQEIMGHYELGLDIRFVMGQS